MPRARAWPGPASPAPWWSPIAARARSPPSSTSLSRATSARPTSARWLARCGLVSFGYGDVAAGAVDRDRVVGRGADQGLRVAVGAAGRAGHEVVPGVAGREDDVDVAAAGEDLQVGRRDREHQGDVAALGLDVDLAGGHGIAVEVAARGEELEGTGHHVAGQGSAPGAPPHR